MNERGWLDRFAGMIVEVTPDAVTASVVMLLGLVGAAFALGNPAVAVMDAYYRGLWMLLPFTMQMTLIVVLSSALASTPFFRWGVARLAGWPTSANQIIALAVLLGAAAGYGYWGLGVALGPVIAVSFAREAERKGIAIDFPYFLAVMFAAGSVWQFGLSASAPLVVATPGHFLEKTIGVIPLARTIWSPASVTFVVVWVAVVIGVGCRLMPKRVRPVSEYPLSMALVEGARGVRPEAVTLSERVEQRPYFAAVLIAVLVAWLGYHFFGLKRSLDINSLVTTLLVLSLAFHRDFKSFTMAVEKGVVSAWPVILLYHLYAGLAGLIEFTNVGTSIAGMAAGVSNALTYPALTAAVSTAFAFFIPSSGGQWAIQGFVTATSAMGVGVTPERGLLALSIGDQMGNLTSPFWYVVVAGIARLDFRRFFGYGLVFAGLWFVIGVAVFTFLPC